MRDAGLITSTALLGRDSSTYLGWLELPQRVADRAFSQGSYSEGSRGTSGNILLNTSPLILSGSSLGETLGWLASLSAQGTGSGGCTSLEIIAKTSVVIVARRSCQSNTLRRLVPFRTVAAIRAVPVSATRQPEQSQPCERQLAGGRRLCRNFPLQLAPPARQLH